MLSTTLPFTVRYSPSPWHVTERDLPRERILLGGAFWMGTGQMRMDKKGTE